MTARHQPQHPWFVCEAKRGVMRGAATRAAALTWMFERYDVEYVEVRWQHAAGVFEYIVSDGYSFSGVFIVHIDQMAKTGFDAHEKPLYPNDSDPYTEVPRD